MKNKIELKKLIHKTLFLLICVVFLFTIINIYEYHEYTKNFNNKINGIVNILQNKYPNVTEQEIIGILSSSASNSKTLSKYGMNLDNKSTIKENDKLYHRNLIINTLVLIISLSIFIFLFIKYLKNREKNINEITKYIKELNKKNYSLLIDSNSEDELSILKNEIYKTTIMLKETRDIVINDKKNLKKSLEDISHQLKTPLTSILVMLDNLIDNPDMDKTTREDFIRDIKRNVVNINFFVQSILKLSKFDANTIKFTKEKRLLKDILDEAIKNVATLCDLKNIKINIKGDSDIKITCDFKWQVEAITNIIKNSLEHSNLDSEIDITYEQNSAYLLLTIQDYGDGILKEELPHIFERFYKGKNASSDSVGIGLALAKTIINNDNGVIDVKSNKKGTKFIIKYFNF